MRLLRSFALVLFCGLSCPLFAKVDVMCVYYPHWHRYPKGIEWFGERWKEGEWSFVKDAKPRFPGHPQPIVPLGRYWDGSNPADVAEEIALAANAGIDVFLYDYYYYDGKVTQEEALEQGFLKADNRSRMKFALMWCFHDRTDQFRPKLGEQRRRLMSLARTPEEFIGFVRLACDRYFHRPEYYRKGGKIFLSIYNACDFANALGQEKAALAVREARELVRARGLGELHLNGQNARRKDVPLMHAVGFDSLTHYSGVPWFSKEFMESYRSKRQVLDYRPYMDGTRKYWATMTGLDVPFFPSVATGWDSSPRCRLDEPFPWKKTEYPYYEFILTNNTPTLLEQNLRAAKALAEKNPEATQIVYINGWNEYTEGSYLIPNWHEADLGLRALAAVFGRHPANEYTYINPSNKKLYAVPAAAHENVAYGPDSKQKLDVFLPQGKKGPFPVIVYLHGGGWEGGAMVDHILGSSLKTLLDRGVAVVAVGYRYLREARLAGEKPPVKACLDDCEAAVRFVKAHAKDWNLDVSRLALAGGSAGACTALYLGLKDGNALGVAALGPIIAQTSLDPQETRAWIPNATYGGHAFGFRNFDDWLAHRERALPWIERFSPAALVRKIAPECAPKMFLQYGSIPKPGEQAKDSTHSGAFGVRFKAICDARGIPCEVFAGGRLPCYGETFEWLADTLLAQDGKER